MKKTKYTNSILIFLAVFMMVLVGCEQPGTDQSGGNQSGSTPESEATQIVIKNQSFTDLEEVLWNGISFSNNEFEDTLKIGTTVSNDVEEGSSYIYFKRKSSPVFARSSGIVFVDTGKTTEFIFTDNTIISENHNDTNTGTLKDLQSTVVFFDDAEGELQQYFQTSHFTGYYSTESDLPVAPKISSNHRAGGLTFVNSPKAGKSIAIGYDSTSSLFLKVNLERSATLSFWVANSWRDAVDESASLAINSAKVTSFPKTGWSFREFALEAGETNIVWSNPSGLSYDDSSSYYMDRNDRQYLSLDDILIVYTE